MSEGGVTHALRQAADLHRQGDLQAALRMYRQVLESAPLHAEALHLAGVAEAQTGAYAPALDLLQRASRLDPLNPFVQINLCSTLSSVGRHAEALTAATAACSTAPDLPMAHVLRGDLLHASHRFDEAAACFARAVALTPGDAATLIRLGNALVMTGRLVDAEQAFSQAAVFDPGSAEVWKQQGLTQLLLQKHPEALSSLDRALNLGPDNADTHHARAVLLLTLGDYARGLPELEWRWRAASTWSGRDRREYSQPQWTGKQGLAGKSILLYSEQGLGDTLQFCRYASRVAELGGSVILQVQRPLMGLMKRLPGISRVMAHDELPLLFDYHCPLMSLPLAFGTRLDSIPAPSAYLAADPDRVLAWRQRLGPHRAPRVGLMWNGNPENLQDRYRSFSLSDWLPHLPSGFDYVSLQRFVRDEDRPALASGMIQDLSAEQHVFDDAAALCECMDLVISVCTSIAHLGAALGRPTWILLSQRADWRWLLHRTDTPWYPTARLYRQRTIGDWPGVFSDVASDLIRELR